MQTPLDTTLAQLQQQQQTSPFTAGQLVALLQLGWLLNWRRDL